MNDLQKKLFEIFIEFDRVCQELNLKYFAVAGTALGAQRHNGFIPWDDDMDIGMLRPDYESFLVNAPLVISKNYFVQSYKSDRDWLAPFAKIRDNKTTAIETIMKRKNINHGVWIDVFPIDNIPDNDRAFKRDALKRRLLIRRLTASNFYPFSVKRKMLDFFIRLIVPSKRWASKVLNEDFFPCELSSSTRVANRFVFGKNKLPINYPSIWFQEIKRIKFESFTINVISENIKYLEAKYGNWKVLPPVNQRKSLHTIGFIDLKHTYKEYINKKL